MSANRTMRISEEIKREVSDIIMNDLKDPRVTGMISVTKASVTNDMRYAKIYVSIMASEDEQKSIIQALKNASGFIRKEIGQRINIRYTPEIIFELDNSIEYGIKISKILKEITPNKEEE